MSDYFDFYMEMPAILMHVDSRRPLCNKGAKAPPPAPPAMAPYEEVQGGADTTFSKLAGQRRGLRSTILSQPTLSTRVEPNAPMTTLGAQSIGLGQRQIAMAAAVANPPAKQTVQPTILGKAVSTLK